VVQGPWQLLSEGHCQACLACAWGTHEQDGHWARRSQEIPEQPFWTFQADEVLDLPGLVLLGEGQWVFKAVLLWFPEVDECFHG
jgi:hypothetical protein